MEGQALRGTLRIEIFIPSEFGVVPGISKLPAGKRQGCELLGRELRKRLVQGDGLAGVEAAECLVGGDGIVNVAGRERHAGPELRAKISNCIEAGPYTATHAIQRSVRGSTEEGLPPKTHVSAERDRSETFDLPLQITDALVGAAGLDNLSRGLILWRSGRRRRR